MISHNKYNAPKHSSAHTVEERQAAYDDMSAEDQARLDASWDQLSAGDNDKAYEEAMNARLKDDFEMMKRSILGSMESNPLTHERANAEGRRAFYLANEIRKARLQVADGDQQSEQWQQTVKAREDRLESLLVEQSDNLNPQEVDFIIDFSGGKYDAVIEDAATDDTGKAADKASAELEPGENSQEKLDSKISQMQVLIKELKDEASDPGKRAQIEATEQQIHDLAQSVASPVAPGREPIFSEEEIAEARGESNDEADLTKDESAVPGTELELYRSAEVRKADVLKRCNDFLRSEDDPERVEMMKGLDESRSDYLAVLAKAQKGHSLRRLKPNGVTNQVLLRLFGEKFSSKTNKPTRKESEARARYEEAYDKMDAQMKLFLHGQRELGNISEAELREIYLETLSAQHLANVREIAQIQKESSKKPMNKWLRRVGYVGAGIGAGLLTTLGPLGWVAGAGLALGGAGGLRVAANKRNANTLNKETNALYVDEKAEVSTKTFQTSVDHSDGGEMSIRDVTAAHDSEVNREVVGNRDRLVRPIVAAIGAAAVARLGVEAYNWLQPTEMTATQDTVPPSPDETRTPAEVDDVKPENIPSDTGTYKPPTDLGSDSAETLATPTEAYVESGSGEIRETKQVLEQVLGTDVSMEDAERVYNTVTQNQGDIFVNDPNYTGPDNDVRIGAPGTYTFKDGIVNKMVEQYNILKS